MDSSSFCLSALPSPPKGILFDWDNTLVDSFGRLKKAIHHTLETFGKATWSDQEVQLYTQRSAKDGLPLIFGDQWPEALVIFTEAYRQGSEDVCPFPGAKDLLYTAFHQNIPLGVVSNKRPEFLHSEIRTLGWTHFFKAIVGSGEAGADKPSPLPALHALQIMNVSPRKDVWFVGDAPVDWECAQAIGCTSIYLGKEKKIGNFSFFMSNCNQLEKLLTGRPI